MGLKWYWIRETRSGGTLQLITMYKLGTAHRDFLRRIFLEQRNFKFHTNKSYQDADFFYLVEYKLEEWLSLLCRYVETPPLTHLVLPCDTGFYLLAHDITVALKFHMVSNKTHLYFDKKLFFNSSWCPRYKQNFTEFC